MIIEELVPPCGHQMQRVAILGNFLFSFILFYLFCIIYQFFLYLSSPFPLLTKLGDNFVNNPNLFIQVEGFNFSSGKPQVLNVKPGILLHCQKSIQSRVFFFSCIYLCFLEFVESKTLIVVIPSGFYKTIQLTAVQLQNNNSKAVVSKSNQIPFELA